MAPKWMKYDPSDLDLPEDPLDCGRDTDGSNLYVGRARFSGDILPVKIVRNRRVSYVTYNGGEFEVVPVKILCGPSSNFAWVLSQDGSVPDNAIPGGETSSGEILYIGRVFSNDCALLGKIHRSKNCLYVGWDGKEHSYKNYEVLVDVTSSK